MKLLHTIVACISLVLVTIALQEKRGWRGIVPLHSTRADVEAILGPSKETCKCTYRTDQELVEIQYATTSCKGGRAGWNVANDTVLSLTVTPKEWQRFSDLGLDESKYSKIRDPDNPTTHFINKDEGIKYTLTDTGMVYSVTFTPSTKDAYLRCPGFPENSDSTSGYPLFDHYFDLSFRNEKARLDNFAAWLHEHPELKGYILVYGGQNVRKAREAQVRADRAKKYMVNVRRIESQRLIPINGGYRERLEVELYALPPNLRGPIPVPTVAPSQLQPVKRDIPLKK